MVIQKGKIVFLLIFACLSLLWFNGCDHADLKERRTAVLNALYYQVLNDSTTRIAIDSYPLHKKNMLKSWDTLGLSTMESIIQRSRSGHSDSLLKSFPFTTDDMAALVFYQEIVHPNANKIYFAKQ